MNRNITFPGVTVSENEPSTGIVVSFSYSDWLELKSCGNHFKMICDENKPFEVLARESSSQIPVILKCSYEKGTVILSQVLLGADAVQVSANKEDFHLLKVEKEGCLRCLRDILKVHMNLDCSASFARPLTPAYFFNKLGTGFAWERLSTHIHKEVLHLHHLKLKFLKESGSNVDDVSSSDPYPVILASENNRLETFDWELYFEHLETTSLGSAVFYTHTVTSTMDLLDGLPVDIGAVSIASIQTKGKGRGGNAWLSPIGCAMFSIQVCVERESHLGQALPFIQQLATLAVILAVKSLPGYQDLDVGLKWPNDLYYAKKIKFGGVLANSTMSGNIFHCYIGLGINLDNSIPTMCLNDIIQLHNKEHGTQLEPIRKEVLIARTISSLERLILSCQEKGTASCRTQLYHHWIHEKAILMLEAIGENVVVQGIDDYGFLCVQRSQGEVLTLHPDGNGLDQMKNLLIAKN